MPSTTYSYQKKKSQAGQQPKVFFLRSLKTRNRLAGLALEK
jgi:hypothetical protein